MQELIHRAARGDEDAWHELVNRHAPVIWSVTRAHRLRGADAADASQNTWAALAEHLPKLRNPDRLAGWLATTARRECLRIMLQGRREVPFDEIEVETYEEPTVFRNARDRLLWQAFGTLPARCRELLGLLAHAPEMTYVQLSRALGIKVNSIGQTRGRCLDTLRRKLLILGGGPE
ncbi:RNA polymerase sigma factor [Actinophytocola sp. NPDC049390]|uniref:RNA polymerase sigma factor n=1 Tax=Actinophytocola sp. NPDC049390 TaxID=3363894 RepID=UPI00379F68A6